MKEESSMVRRILLMKMTDQGAKDIKNAPQRIEEGIKSYEKMGGKMIAFYAVTGKYDYIAIGESPNEEIGMAFNIALSALGNVRVTTINAFTKEEFAKMVQMLP